MVKAMATATTTTTVTAPVVAAADVIAKWISQTTKLGSFSTPGITYSIEIEIKR